MYVFSVGVYKYIDNIDMKEKNFNKGVVWDFIILFVIVDRVEKKLVWK